MARTFITAEDVAKLPEGHRLTVDDNTTITPPARELARRRGVTIVDGGEVASTAGRAPTRAPTAPVPATVLTDAHATNGPHAVHAHDASARHGGQTPQTIIVTAVGVNRPGVLAEVTDAIGKLGGDIQDLSQKITGGYFNAILVVDIRRAKQAFAAFAEALKALSEPTDYVVTVVDERVFRAMHRL